MEKHEAKSGGFQFARRQPAEAMGVRLNAQTSDRVREVMDAEETTATSAVEELIRHGYEVWLASHDGGAAPGSGKPPVRLPPAPATSKEASAKA
jgi:hypothetical protein